MYKIITAYNNVYLTDKDGYVLEYSNGLKKSATDENRKTWQLTGAVRYSNNGYITEEATLEDLLTSQLTYKNGRPRYTLTDIDHGTHRIHGNIKAHGIRYITKI